MHDPDQAMMREVAAAILENAAFVFSEWRENAWPDLGDQVWEAEIDVAGARMGRVAFATTPAFAGVLASNLLGIEPEDVDSEQSREDAVREILNMICGALLERWNGPDSACSMGTPRLSKTTPAAHRQAYETARPLVQLVAEDHCVDLAFFDSRARNPPAS